MSMLAYIDQLFESNLLNLKESFLVLNEILFVFELGEAFTKKFKALSFDPFEMLLICEAP